MAGTNGHAIINPNAPPVLEVTYRDGPLAQPSVVTMSSPAGPKVLMIGGLSKLEQMAALIAGTLAAPGVLTGSAEYLEGKLGADRDAAFEAMVALRAVNIAAAIQAECRRRATQAKEGGA